MVICRGVLLALHSAHKQEWRWDSRFFASAKRPDRLWGPHSSPIQWAAGLTPAGNTSHIHTVPRLTVTGAVR